MSGPPGQKVGSASRAARGSALERSNNGRREDTMERASLVGSPGRTEMPCSEEHWNEIERADRFAAQAALAVPEFFIRKRHSSAQCWRRNATWNAGPRSTRDGSTPTCRRGTGAPMAGAPRQDGAPSIPGALFVLPQIFAPLCGPGIPSSRFDQG